MNDRFYRQLVHGMRNGVLAVTRDGRVAVMNEVARRILELPPQSGGPGDDLSAALASQPDMVRILSAAFHLPHLPNRAELLRNGLTGVRELIRFEFETLAVQHEPPVPVPHTAFCFEPLPRTAEGTIDVAALGSAWGPHLVMRPRTALPDTAASRRLPIDDAPGDRRPLRTAA